MFQVLKFQKIKKPIKLKKHNRIDFIDMIRLCSTNKNKLYDYLIDPLNDADSVYLGIITFCKYSNDADMIYALLHRSLNNANDLVKEGAIYAMMDYYKLLPPKNFYNRLQNLEKETNSKYIKELINEYFDKIEDII